MHSQYKRSAPAEHDSFDDGFTFKKSRNSDIINENQNGGSDYMPSPQTLEEVTGFLNQVLSQNNGTPSKRPYPMLKREPALSPSQRSRPHDTHTIDDVKDVKPLAIIFDDDEYNTKDNSWNPSRRSSFMSRSKQQSSFSRTSVAFPHPHLEPKNFYKHIMPDLPDPVRMRQLLSWCGHKLLSDPKGEGKKSPAEILVSNPLGYKRKPNPRNQRNLRLVEKYERTAAIMEKEDIAWRSVAMKLNNYHASVLDSCPPLPKASEQEGDNSLNTRFQQYYLDGISQDQLQFLNNYCTPSSTDDIDAKMSRTVDSLEAKVDLLRNCLGANLNDQHSAERFGIAVLEKLSGLLDKREGMQTDISEENHFPLVDTIEVLRVLSNKDTA
ncbi:unnamed protein product [Umbelopsis vinacea]